MSWPVSSDTDQAEEWIDQERRHPGLIEKREQLMHLQQEMLLLRHGGEVTVQAIDHHHGASPFLDRTKNPPRELARRHFRRVDLRDLEQAFLDVA